METTRSMGDVIQGIVCCKANAIIQAYNESMCCEHVVSAYDSNDFYRFIEWFAKTDTGFGYGSAMRAWKLIRDFYAQKEAAES